MCTVLLCLAKCLHNFIFCEATVKIWLYQINATKGQKEQEERVVGFLQGLWIPL